MLSNFANSTPTNNPITGQLWYDTDLKKLKVYNGGYTTVGSAVVSDLQPVGQEPGEFWYDSTQSILKFLNADGQYIDLVSDIDVIKKDQLQSIVAASTSFSDFQTRIAAI